MTSQTVYPHIEKVGNQPARLQRLSRIRVAQIVMDSLIHGWSVEEIGRQHPYLRPAEAYAAMGYYFDHQEEIDGEIRAEWGQVQLAKAETLDSPFVVRMKASAASRLKIRAISFGKALPTTGSARTCGFRSP